MSEDEELLDEDDSDELNWVAIGIAAVVLIAVIGAAAWYFFIREDPMEAAGIEVVRWEEPERFEEEEIIGPPLFPELVISPYDGQGRYYLSLQLSFLVGNRDQAFDLIMDRPGGLQRVQNIVIDVFTSYTLDELRQPKFKEEARQILKDRLNEMAGWKGIPPEMEGLPEEDLPKPPLVEIYFDKFILS